MEDEAGWTKAQLDKIIASAQEMAAEIDAKVQARTLLDNLDRSDFQEINDELECLAETLEDMRKSLPWNWTIPEYDVEMISSIFSAAKLMEEANAPFFVRWYRKVLRALDKLMRKP